MAEIRCGLLIPKRHHKGTRFKLEHHTFRDPVIARMAMIARLLDADMAAPTYWAMPNVASFTPAAALQTALAVVTTSTDYALLLLGWSLGYGASAAQAGSPVRVFSSDGTTAGTSTAGTVTQNSGRTVNTTGLTAPFNFTVEPTVKTYLGPQGELQGFGGEWEKSYDNINMPDAFVSGKTTFGLEHTPPNGTTPTAASILFCRG